MKAEENCIGARLAGFAHCGYHLNDILRFAIAEQIFDNSNEGKGVLCRHLVGDRQARQGRREWGRRGPEALRRRSCRLPA